MTAGAVAAVAAAAASVYVLTDGAQGRRRLSTLSAARDSASSTGRHAGRAGRRLGWSAPATSDDGTSTPATTRVAASLLGGVGLVVSLGGAAGLALGVIGALTLYVVLGRLEPRAVRERREKVARDLPAAASLLAAAVSAGATPVAAVEVVATAVAGPLGEDMHRLAAVARLGGDFSTVVGPTGADSSTARLTRVVARAIDTGAPLAQALDRLAADLHAERRFEIDRRARAVGVRAAAPLGLCFLPGFLLIGVVPVIAGIAATVLGGVV